MNVTVERIVKMNIPKATIDKCASGFLHKFSLTRHTNSYEVEKYELDLNTEQPYISIIGKLGGSAEQKLKMFELDKYNDVISYVDRVWVGDKVVFDLKDYFFEKTPDKKGMYYVLNNYSTAKSDKFLR